MRIRFLYEGEYPSPLLILYLNALNEQNPNAEIDITHADINQLAQQWKDNR